MILNNYSVAKSHIISNISIPNIEDPVKINILWLQVEDFNHKSKRLNQALHKHNFFEAHFVLEGKNIIVNKDNENTVISEGEGVLFNPNFLHRTQDSSDQLKRFSIAFQFLEDNEIKKDLMSNKIFAFKMTKKMIDHIDCAFLELNKESAFTAYILRNIIFGILSEIILISKVKLPSFSLQSDALNLKIKKAKKFINDNLGILLTCKVVADYCNYNEIYLNRIFKKATGESLINYIHRKKSESAQQLLKETDIKIKNISKLLGFENEYHFSLFFKKEVGISPSQYRKADSLTP